MNGRETVIYSKKVLLIIYKYTPEIAPRVFRWSSIVSEWTREAINVDIICAAYPGTQREEIIDSSHIYRIIPWFKKKQLSQPAKYGFSKIVEDEFSQTGEDDSSQMVENESSQTVEDESSRIENFPQETMISTNAEVHASFLEIIKEYMHLAIANKVTESGEDITFKFILKKVVNKAKMLTIKLVRKIKKIIIFFLKKVLNKIRHISKRIVRKIKRFVNKARNLNKKKVKKFKKILRSYLWPDYGMLWIPPAFFMARKLIKQNQYSAIITVSWIVSPHVVGSLIHKYISKNTPWIVDIGDPFSFNKITPINDFKKFAQKNHKFEENLLRDASAISVTTEETKKDYIKFFPGAESKTVVIPPLIPLKKKRTISSKKLDLPNKKKIKLVFTGSLRSKNRRPDVLLHLFLQLVSIQEFTDCLEIHFYGSINQCLNSFIPYKDLIKKQIFLHGIVKKEIVDEVLTQADFLVNIGNVSENQLPSKIVEYLSANRPIINIATNPSDSSWDFLSSSGLALNILASTPRSITPEIIGQVADFINNPPRPLSVERLNNLITPYSTETVSKQYLQIIQALVDPQI